jgi:hypothetical protein
MKVLYNIDVQLEYVLIYNIFPRLFFIFEQSNVELNNIIEDYVFE